MQSRKMAQSLITVERNAFADSLSFAAQTTTEVTRLYQVGGQRK
jgi:hypothetical protein